MPDGATHILVQVILNKTINENKLIPYLLFGAVAPDLFKAVSRIISPQYEWFFHPTHSPIFMLMTFYAISLLFHQSERILLIKGSMIGMVIHLLLDLTQINYGGGNYMPFFPFSFHSVSFGLIKTESSIYWLPVTIALTVLILKINK
tara:strand:- start:438 stop:878 length:441 start_codon:yes stop_codon:yes gene_type:complete